MKNNDNREPIDAIGLDLQKLPPESWRPFEVENQRKGERIGERELERIPAWVKSVKYPQWAPVKLRDYSVLGFGIQYDSIPGKPFSALIGEDVQLKIVDHLKTESIVKCRIKNTGLPGKGLRLGLRRMDIQSLMEPASMGFPGNYLSNRENPVDVKVANPFLYDEWADAGLIGIGPGNEWVFESSDTALLLLPGHTLRLFIQLPMENGGMCSGDIVWTSVREGDRILFSVRWSDIPFELSNAVGEYLLQSWGCSPGDLPRYGIMLKRFKEQLRFRFISTQHEYEQVLELRRNAYVYAGKRDESTEVEQLASMTDKYSRILAAFHHDTMVASLALTFPNNDSFRLRSEDSFPGNKYPVAIPPKGKLLEAHSLCTHKDFRGGDLFQGMMVHALRCLILSDRRWAITLVTDQLLPLYQRFGFRKTGATTSVPSLNNIRHHLIALDTHTVTNGMGLNPLDWEYFYGELIRDLLDKRLLTLSTWRNVVLYYRAIMGGFAKHWIKRRLEKQFRAQVRKALEKEKVND
ncbi:MAG: type pilus assembly PilZ [Fibrobacteres bacterium]|nr:type pilus assembly PilZ [Fibrobacterota bacterium]